MRLEWVERRLGALGVNIWHKCMFHHLARPCCSLNNSFLFHLHQSRCGPHARIYTLRRCASKRAAPPCRSAAWPRAFCPAASSPQQQCLAPYTQPTACRRSTLKRPCLRSLLASCRLASCLPTRQTQLLCSTATLPPVPAAAVTTAAAPPAAAAAAAAAPLPQPATAAAGAAAPQPQQ